MLPKLVLLENNQAVSNYVIDQETFTIGRKPENDLIIDDTAVSGRHARILIIGTDAFIEDLQSTNGTLINNYRITKQMLADGDSILVGRHRLKFVAAKEDTPTQQPRAYAIGMEGDTAFEKPSPLPQSPENKETTTAKKETRDAENQEAILELISGPDAGKKMALTKSISRLGKPGEQVAAIARRPGGYFLMHLGGNTAQPALNGEAVSAPVTLLNEGDVIELGKIRMKFLLT